MSNRKAYVPKQLPVDGLPNRLRSCRIAKNLTVKAIAEHLAVSPQAVHKAETTGEGLGKKKWYLLADLFECDPRYLESPEPDKNILQNPAEVSTNELTISTK